MASVPLLKASEVWGKHQEIDSTISAKILDWFSQCVKILAQDTTEIPADVTENLTTSGKRFGVLGFPKFVDSDEPVIMFPISNTAKTRRWMKHLGTLIESSGYSIEIDQTLCGDYAVWVTLHTLPDA